MIPHRFIRCVPSVVPAECEAWWARFGELHPGWELLTVADPIDPADWPLLGRWHHLATSGAQLAGMVRLEAVWRWGGWYVDMDVEPVRPFDRLDAGDRVVIGTEDGVYLTDAVFGAPARHPAIRAVIDHIDELYRWIVTQPDRPLPGAQATGPLAWTAVLGDRTNPPDGVVVLPPPVFYPYSYLERHRANEPHGADPAVHAIHRWHFTWNGT